MMMFYVADVLMTQFEGGFLIANDNISSLVFHNSDAILKIQFNVQGVMLNRNI